MIAKLWNRLRQTDEIDALRGALADKIHLSKIDEAALANLRRDLEIERAKRVGAEAVAAERRAEVDRLLAELVEARTATERAYAERLKSLDSLNVRLMEPRVEPPSPDMKKVSIEAAAMRMGVATAMRNAKGIDRYMDMQILNLAKRKTEARAPVGPVLNAEGA